MVYVEYFGELDGYILSTDAEDVKEGDIVTLVNSNCEFEFDNYYGCFEKNILYYYIVDLELVETDLTNFIVEKSNNGGNYGFAKCKVLKVYEKNY